MMLTSVDALAELAEGLRDDEIHVWQVDYQPMQGRTVLRRVLAAYLGVHADEVALIEGEYGRPWLAPPLPLSLGFNWSHSGHYALIAIGRHIIPGIDLERRRARPRALEIAQRYFTPEETASLAELPIERRHELFLVLWTAKEAVLKAVGRGLGFGLDRLNIVSNCGKIALQRLDGDDVSQWQLHALTSQPGLVGALAWRGEPRRVRLGELVSVG